MAKSQPKISLSEQRAIPLDKLVLSQSNVRQVKAGVNIEQLAESIARRTLLQSLTVRAVVDEAGQETGVFEVPAGGRRFRALELLARQKRLAKNAPIPCIVRTEGIAEEDSLAENIERAPLHPLDQFRAFQAMREKGMGEEDIAAAFFTTVGVVKQRLRLAAVSPALLDVYAEDGITLDQLMAFTVNPDPQRQEQVWEAIQVGYTRQPYEIRRMLTEGAVRASDRRAQFVGVEAYVEAGGEVLNDLFQADDGGWLQDASLLDMLVAEKLREAADEVAAEGFKWTETFVDLPYAHLYGLRRLNGDQLELTPEQAAARDALLAEQERIETEYATAEELSDEADTRMGEIETALEELEVRTDLPSTPELDPELVRDEEALARELRLRPEPPRVVRLSRKALGTLAGVAMVGVGGALLFALRPAGEAERQEELVTTDNRATADGLANLPRDYAGVPRAVPQLGPPLPGDLGRPMLNAGVQPQPGEMPGAVPPPPAYPHPTQPDPAAQRREQERQRRLQEIDAARTSRLFAAETRTEATGQGAPPAPAGAPPPAVATADTPALPPTRGDRQLAFLNGPTERRTASLERIQPAPGRNVIQAGSIIAAALITGLRSDLPGQVTAQVTENVYDSVTGRTLLVPQGARLIGQYDAEVAFGQSRALLVWTRLILPDGRSLTLERQPAADAQGRAGLQDRVDRRWGELFRAAAVSTLLGVGSELAAGDSEDRLVEALRRGAQDAIDDAGQQFVRRSLNVEPILTVRPGYPVRVILTRDLVLEPWTE